MKIYFSGSIRGGRDHAGWYSFLVEELGKYGEVVSEFVADKSLTSYGTLNMTDKEIYDRDISFLNKSDIFIADITIPSLGVGYEIAYAEKLNKNIFCLYHQIEDKRVSAMIVGNPKCKVFPYSSKDEIKDMLKSIFK